MLLERRLVGWLVLLFACMLVDRVSDALAEGNLNMYLTESFALSDVSAGAWVSVFSVVAALYQMIAGPLIDRWPRRGPMAAAAITKAVGALSLAGLVAIAGDARFFGLTLVLFNTVYAAAEAFGSLAYTLSLRRLGATTTPDVRELLFRIDYAVGNAAALASTQIVSGLRAASSPDMPRANTWTLAVALVLYVAAALLAAIIYWRHQVREPATYRLKEDVPSRHKTRRPAQIRPFLAFQVCMIGARVAFSAMGLVAPKYIIRHYGEVEGYSFFLGLNPLLMIVLAVLLWFVPLEKCGPPVVALIVGTTLVAAAPIGLVLLPDTRWGIVVYLATLTAGEALAMPQIKDYILKDLIVPGTEGTTLSVAAVIDVPMAFALPALHGVLVGALCPPDACETAMVWFPVLGLGLLTPVALGLFAIVRPRCCPPPSDD